MTEYLLRSITKGKFEENHPHMFSSIKSVCEQIEDWAEWTGDEAPQLMEVIELERAPIGLLINARNATQDVIDMLADRERKREEESKERFEITASGRTREIKS